MPIWIRTLMIAAGSVAFANSLRAEPIPWNYSSTLTVLGGPNWMVAYPDQVLAGGTANTTTAAVVWGNSGWEPLGGSRTLTVGEAHPGAELTPDNPLLMHTGYASSFDFVFNLQDIHSGQSTTLSFRGKVNETDTINDDGPPYFIVGRSEKIYLSDPSLATPWLATKSLRLGENDYHIDLKERQDGFGTSYIDAVVQVEKYTQAPEPSTMAMGAIGLAGLALAWRRRRRAAVKCFTKPRR